MYGEPVYLQCEVYGCFHWKPVFKGKVLQPGNWELLRGGQLSWEFAGAVEEEPVYVCGERPSELPGSKRAWVLIEAKGNYSNFVNKKTREFYKWFNGKDSFIAQAKRQSDAANGIKIQWYFNDEISMNAKKELFSDPDVKGIEFILKPIK